MVEYKLIANRGFYLLTFCFVSRLVAIVTEISHQLTEYEAT
jgi:hypothetical protein